MGFGRRLTACLPRPEGSSGEIYLLRRRGSKNQAGGLRIGLRMAMARAHLAPFLTMSHRRRCRHSEVLTPVRKSKNGGSPKIGDFRGWVGNPRIPGVGRCLDRGVADASGRQTPLARGEQSDPRTAENADCSGFAARLRALEVPALRSRGLRSRGPSFAGERA